MIDHILMGKHTTTLLANAEMHSVRRQRYAKDLLRRPVLASLRQPQNESVASRSEMKFLRQRANWRGLLHNLFHTSRISDGANRTHVLVSCDATKTKKDLKTVCFFPKPKRSITGMTPTDRVSASGSNGIKNTG